MSRVVILAFSLGILAGFVLAMDTLSLDIAAHYSGDERAALTQLIEGLRP